MEKLNESQVLIKTKDIRNFARQWPGSGMRDLDNCLIVSFDSKGLNDIEWLDLDGVTVSEPNGIDQTALAAIVDDAVKFGTKVLL